jgi:hypothetical protein
MFRNDNVTAQDPPKEYIFIQTNRGVTGKLFDNPYLSKYLYSIGLTPQTIFGCAMNFLFHPKNEVRPDARCYETPMALRLCQLEHSTGHTQCIT